MDRQQAEDLGWAMVARGGFVDCGVKDAVFDRVYAGLMVSGVDDELANSVACLVSVKFSEGEG